MRCVPTEHIVRAFASGASSFATPTGGGKTRSRTTRVACPTQAFFRLAQQTEALLFQAEEQPA